MASEPISHHRFSADEKDHHASTTTLDGGRMNELPLPLEISDGVLSLQILNSGKYPCFSYQPNPISLIRGRKTESRSRNDRRQPRTLFQAPLLLLILVACSGFGRGIEAATAAAVAASDLTSVQKKGESNSLLRAKNSSSGTSGESQKRLRLLLPASPGRQLQEASPGRRLQASGPTPLPSSTPTASVAPSAPPSVSHAPTISTAPSFFSTNPPTKPSSLQPIPTTTPVSSTPNTQASPTARPITASPTTMAPSPMISPTSLLIPSAGRFIRRASSSSSSSVLPASVSVVGSSIVRMAESSTNEPTSSVLAETDDNSPPTSFPLPPPPTSEPKDSSSTSEPTDASTSEPTDSSANKPKDSPTNEPTDSSTSEPTDANSSPPPTSAATGSPPTSAPTISPPISEPTAAPWLEEMAAAQTSEPTSPQTSEPTRPQTSEPTRSQTTSEPTSSQMREPTSSETSEPTNSQMSEPTSSETSEPTSEPTGTQPEYALPTMPPLMQLSTLAPTGSTTLLLEDAAAQPTSAPFAQTPSPTSAPLAVETFQQDATQCSGYPACAALGLSGDCCPTLDGNTLECCSSAPIPTPEPSPALPPFFESDEPTTNSPTSSPIFSTAAPVDGVTDPPTLLPTESPLETVTDPPVLSPTGSPLEGVTDPPALPPTERPAEEVTDPPAPDPAPTMGPTPQPSPFPVANQASVPTMFPTLRPNPLPTTANPTQDPTSIPLPSPTATTQLTSAPTTSTPTNAPSAQPSISFAPSLSPMPSAAPTLSFEYKKSSLTAKGVRMNLGRGSRRLQEGGNTIDSNCTQIWQDAVRDSIEREVQAVIQKYETIQVVLSNVSTSTEATTLSFIFDVLIDIRSPVTEHDVRRYIEGPFDAEVEKQAFAEFLRSTGCPEFENVSTVEVVVPRASNEKSPSGDNGTASAGLIAGLVLATAAIILLAATFVFLRVRKNRGLYHDDDSPPVSEKNKYEHSRFEFSSEIEGLNTNTDISTLGDPIPAGTSRQNDNCDQSTIGSVSVEYDYQRAFLDVQSVADSQLVDSNDGSSPRRTLATLDDPSLIQSDVVTAADETYGSPFGSEEQFDVAAPSGLLGLILESSAEDGRPTVNSIKPMSVLAHVVKVGDRVVAVDGEYVTTMRASDVSRLIAAKKDKARVLVFSRPSKRPTFSIHEDINAIE